MNITVHAWERMSERGFSPEMIGKLLAGKFSVRPSRDGLFRITGMAGGKAWTLVVSADLDTLITVRRAHKEAL